MSRFRAEDPPTARGTTMSEKFVTGKSESTTDRPEIVTHATQERICSSRSCSDDDRLRDCSSGENGESTCQLVSVHPEATSLELLALPDDVLRAIVCHLDVASAGRMARTCRRLNTIVCEHTPLWQGFCKERRVSVELRGCTERAQLCREALRKRYSREAVKERWMRGDYSQLTSTGGDDSLFSMPIFSDKLTKDDWGDIFEAEMSR